MPLHDRTRVRRIRSLRIPALVIAVLLPACRTPEVPLLMKVTPDVVDAVRVSDSAQVLISLEPPPGYGEEGTDLEAVRVRIARDQDEVLAALAPEDYRNRLRFDAVPALAGTVLSERALRVLDGHPNVVQVALDPAGGGGGT